jgi:uncharacterized membrane protein YraQ (UPF0718 family)
MIDFLFGVLQALWQILEDASVYLLFGFLLAGVLAVCVPRRLLTRLVGTGRIRSVLWGSVMGAPLPVCSCGVLPTAVGLHKQGATPGATVAFLVATPETGADSISLTYALTDPLMTVYRPIAGVLTAIAAGILTNFFGATPRPLGASDERPNGDNNPVHEHGHTHENGHGHALDHAHGHDHGREPDHSRHISPVIGGGPAGTVLGAARQVVRYGFGELFDDVAW